MPKTCWDTLYVAVTTYIFAAMNPFVVWLDKKMTIGTNGSCGVEKAWRHPSFAIAWTSFQREQLVAVFAFHTVIRIMHLTFIKLATNISCLLNNLLLPSLSDSLRPWVNNPRDSDYSNKSFSNQQSIFRLKFCTQISIPLENYSEKT